MLGQHRDFPVQGLRSYLTEQRYDPVCFAESVQHPERGECAQDLRFVIVVFIVPMRSIQGHTQFVFERIPGSRLFQRRVGLNRQRLGGGQNLEQKRQLAVKPCGYLSTENVGRRLIYQFVQRPRAGIRSNH